MKHEPQTRLSIILFLILQSQSTRKLKKEKEKKKVQKYYYYSSHSNKSKQGNQYESREFERPFVHKGGDSHVCIMLHC